jgi:two-component system, chemotaxis family, response regulator WspR
MGKAMGKTGFDEAYLSAFPQNDKAMVLLVDDQLMVVEAVRRALLDAPRLEFHYCMDPMEAVAVVRTLRPTVVLQDLVMPGVDGLDLVSQYRADPTIAGVPIIVLSAKEEPATKCEAFRRGANDYLVKLPDKIELIARIRYHTRAYLNQVQRDEAYRALRESQQQLMEANLELQRLNKVDGLTGLSNRRYFDEYLDAEWKRAVRTEIPIALLMIDVDCFKAYNDTYGHVGGDDVLRKVADAVADHCTRPTDAAARYGGEEFAMILPHTDADGVLALGQTVCRAIEALHIPHRGSTVGEHLTVSIGATSVVPGPAGPMMASLIETADKALYKAKRAGKNCVVLLPHGGGETS